MDIFSKHPFETDKEYRIAERRAKTLNLAYESRIRSIHIIRLKDDLSEIDWTKELPL